MEQHEEQLSNLPISIAPATQSSPGRIDETMRTPQVVSQGCGCGGSADAKTNGIEAAIANYIFAIGRIEMRFPSLAVEKEFAQAVGRTNTGGLSDRQAVHAALSERQNHYLLNQLCWVLTIEGLDTYILYPRNPVNYDLLLEAVRANRALWT